MASEGHRRLFACYLLVSLNPQKKGRTYIGFTVNPERRIRQHNGLIANGAKHTSRLRPLEMVLVVHGFPSQVQALQFEWAWQNPGTSRAVREAAARLRINDRSFSVPNKVRLLFEMLRLPVWSRYPLGVRFLSAKHQQLQQHCSPLPEHMPVHVGDLEGLWAHYSKTAAEEAPDADAESDGDPSDLTGSCQSRSAASRNPRAHGMCLVCERALGGERRHILCPCGARAHVLCLATRFLQEEDAPATQLLPSGGHCPACEAFATWATFIAATANGLGRPALSPTVTEADDATASDKDPEEVDSTPRSRAAPASAGTTELVREATHRQEIGGEMTSPASTPVVTEHPLAPAPRAAPSTAARNGERARMARWAAAAAEMSAGESPLTPAAAAMVAVGAAASPAAAPNAHPAGHSSSPEVVELSSSCESTPAPGRPDAHAYSPPTTSYHATPHHLPLGLHGLPRPSSHGAATDCLPPSLYPPPPPSSSPLPSPPPWPSPPSVHADVGVLPGDAGVAAAPCGTCSSSLSPSSLQPTPVATYEAIDLAIAAAGGDNGSDSDSRSLDGSDGSGPPSPPPLVERLAGRARAAGPLPGAGLSRLPRGAATITAVLDSSPEPSPQPSPKSAAYRRRHGKGRRS